MINEFKFKPVRIDCECGGFRIWRWKSNARVCTKCGEHTNNSKKPFNQPNKCYQTQGKKMHGYYVK